MHHRPARDGKLTAMVHGIGETDPERLGQGWVELLNERRVHRCVARDGRILRDDCVGETGFGVAAMNPRARLSDP
jgi:hypothetical protein